MSEDPEVPEDEEKKGSKLPLLIGLVLALLGGGGGFFAVSSCLLFGGSADPEMMSEGDGEADGGAEMAEMSPSGDEIELIEDDPYARGYEPSTDISFVPLDPIVISLPPGSANTHLRFTAQLEVVEGFEEEVANLAPRVVDVLNGYLRAVEVTELEDHTAFPRLRAQMLRRVQVVAGPEVVQDILIQEFILN